MPGTAQEFMYFVGVVEMAAGIVVLISPKWGSLLVAGWLGGIVVTSLPPSRRSTTTSRSAISGSCLAPSR